MGRHHREGGESPDSDSGRRSRRHDSESKKRKRSHRDSSPARPSSSSSSSSSSKKVKVDRDKGRSNDRHKGKSKKKEAEPVIDLPGGAQPITAEDYFVKSTEFTLWLSASRGCKFSELSAEKSRKYFEKFVKKWNRGKLPQRFYEGINATEIDTQLRTTHKWKIKMDETDKEKLSRIRDSVDSSTHHKEYEKSFGKQRRPPPAASATSSNTIPLGTRAPVAAGDRKVLEEEERQAKYEREKKERKRLMERKKEALEEVAPRVIGGGREARIEKQKAAREQRREREYSPEPDADKLMGGDSDFKAMVAARNRRFEKKKQAKQEEIAQKRNDYESKEADKMQMFKDMVAAGQFQRL